MKLILGEKCFPQVFLVILRKFRQPSTLVPLWSHHTGVHCVYGQDFSM